MNLRNTITFLLLCAQVPAGAQFQLNGFAEQVSPDCYRLTADQNDQAGSIWHLDQVDLRESFDLILDIFLGCKDNNGADGIVIGFQPISASLGTWGGGLGFQYIAPSIGIEFDTYLNDGLNDPEYDHLAIIRDGILDHNSGGNLAGPIQIKTGVSNIEDCQYHLVRVRWLADLQQLEVYVDCEFRLSYTGDIVEDIFGGDPFVYWGFTAATGGLNNIQEICLRYTTFLDAMEDMVLCPNGKTQLQAAGGYSAYQWYPEAGLSDAAIPNPVASPEETTVYVVEILDECQNPFYDSVTVLVDGDTSFVDLGADTTICDFDFLQLDATTPGGSYQWSTGATEAVLVPATSALYSVTVTLDDYCQASDWKQVTILPTPQVQFPLLDSICEGATFLLDATIDDPDALYVWQDGSGFPVFEVARAGLYAVSVSNQCGEAYDQIEIAYENCRSVYFPNAITPNFDGINDVFFPMDEGDVEEVIRLAIFDRWGNQVFRQLNFRPNDEQMGWDGRYQGARAPAGVYVWVAELRYRTGQTGVLSGALHLIR